MWSCDFRSRGSSGGRAVSPCFRCGVLGQAEEASSRLRSRLFHSGKVRPLVPLHRAARELRPDRMLLLCRPLRRLPAHLSWSSLPPRKRVRQIDMRAIQYGWACCHASPARVTDFGGSLLSSLFQSTNSARRNSLCRSPCRRGCRACCFPPFKTHPVAVATPSHRTFRRHRHFPNSRPDFPLNCALKSRGGKNEIAAAAPEGI